MVKTVPATEERNRFVVMMTVMFVRRRTALRPNKKTLHIFIVIEIIVIVITKLFTIGKRSLEERLTTQVHSNWWNYSLYSFIFFLTFNYSSSPSWLFCCNKWLYICWTAGRTSAGEFELDLWWTIKCECEWNNCQILNQKLSEKK